MKVGNTNLYSRFFDKGPSTAERIIRTIRNLIKSPVFEKEKANWISKLPSNIKHYINTIHSSPKKTPVQVSLKKNGKTEINNPQDRRKKLKPQFQSGELGRKVDIKKFLVKAIVRIGHTTYIL